MSSIKLTVTGKGHVPSFKNSKMLTRGRLITKPEFQEWMQGCVVDFESQLRSVYQTTETEMPMVRSLRCWIACVVPLKDSVRHIVDERILVELVAPGEEGATIVIEPA
jgi:hypothetical protein